MASKDELKDLRKKFHAMLSQYEDRLEHSVHDSDKAERKVVYSSENSIAMLGFGDEGEFSEVSGDTFHKTIVQIDGTFDIEYKNGGKESFDSVNTHVEIEPLKDFKAISTKDNTVNLIVLRKITPLIIVLLLLSCSITYKTTKTTTLKVDKKQQTTEGK
jgi:hypothetical protein